MLSSPDALAELVRRPADGDRRVVATIATKRGLDLLELAAPLHQLQHKQFGLLSKREMEQLISGLEKVQEGMAQLDWWCGRDARPIRTSSLRLVFDPLPGRVGSLMRGSMSDIIASIKHVHSGVLDKNPTRSARVAFKTQL